MSATPTRASVNRGARHLAGSGLAEALEETRSGNGALAPTLRAGDPTKVKANAPEESTQKRLRAPGYLH